MLKEYKSRYNISSTAHIVIHKLGVKLIQKIQIKSLSSDNPNLDEFTCPYQPSKTVLYYEMMPLQCIEGYIRQF